MKNFIIPVLVCTIFPFLYGAESIFNDGGTHHIYYSTSNANYVYDTFDGTPTTLIFDPGNYTYNNTLVDHSSFIKIYGGRCLSGVKSEGNSSVYMEDGIIESGFSCSSRSTVTMVGGTVGHTTSIKNNGYFEMSGGTLERLEVYGTTAKALIKGGVITGEIESGSLSGPFESVITIVGAGFNYPYGEIPVDSGILTGTLLSGDSINVQFYIHEEANIVLAPIPEPSTLTLIAPNGGENLSGGVPFPITWISTGSTSNVLLEYSVNGGLVWTPIATVSNTGLYGWLAPPIQSNECRIRISDAAHPSINDISDGIFVIEDKIQLTISKFTAKAGKVAGLDSVQFAGQMNATVSDILTANEIIVSLDCVGLTAPKEWVILVDEIEYKNNQFKYVHKGNVSQRNFMYSLANGKVSFKAVNVDLKGLVSPLTVTITIGANSTQVELDESIINGPKKPCPLQFLMGVKNSLSVDTFKVKPGKNPGTDSFTAQGTFTISGNYDKANLLAVTLGGQTFTVPGGQFINNKDTERCKKALSIEGPVVDAKLDFVKCTYTISVKNATITQSGLAEFGIGCFGYSLPTQSVVVP